MGLTGLHTAAFAEYAVSFYVDRLCMYSQLAYAMSVETVMSDTQIPGLNMWFKLLYETYFGRNVGFEEFLSTGITFLLVGINFWKESRRPIRGNESAR